MSVYAFTTHSSCDTPIFSPRPIDGSATFTIVLSSMIMNSENETAPSVHHRRFPSWMRSMRQR